MRKHELFAAIGGGIALSALSVASAMAAAPMGFAGSLSGNYSNVSGSGGGGNADTFGGDGSGAFGLGTSDLAAQIDVGYHKTSVKGPDLDSWNIGGSLFWAPMEGRLGAQVGYLSWSVSSLDVHFTNYGGVGEYYAGDMITLFARGGGLHASASFSGFGGSTNGGYVGGGFTGYATPDFALTGMVDYTDLSGGSVTNLTAQAEWLVSESTPISVFGGYTYSSISGAGGNLNTVFIGIKLYTSGNGDSLVEKHRNGTLNVPSTIGLRTLF